jgi:hypothetical protein
MPDPRLFERVAKVLAGRLVVVRLQQPVIKSFDGQAYLYNGKATIDIRPGHSDKPMLYIFCHEVGHIKAGTACDLDPSLLPGSLELTQLGAWARKVHPVTTAIENDANRLAAVWQAYAEAHYREYPGGWLEARLKCLADYPMAELLDYASKRGALAGANYARRKIS